MSKRTSPLIALFVLMGLIFAYQSASAQGDSDPARADATAAAPVPISQFLLQFDLPGTPTNLTVEAPGRVWATLPGIDAIGVISVTGATSQTVTAYITRTYQLAAGSQPYNLTTHGGYVWFTAYAGNWVGRLEPVTGAIDAYALPQANSGPTGIDVAPDGVVWFAMRNANRLGKIQSVTNMVASSNTYSSQYSTYLPLIQRPIDSYAYTIVDGGLEEVVAVRSESIWITAPNANRLVGFDPVMTEFINVPTLPYTRPVGLVVEASDNPWVSLQGSNHIGRYAPGTLALWRWTPLPLDNTVASGPQQLALTGGVGPWQMFYSNAAAQTIGRAEVGLDTAVGAIYPIKLGSICTPLDVAAETSGRGWFSCGSANIVLLWQPPYYLDAYQSLLSKQ